MTQYTCWVTPRGTVTLCEVCLRWEDHDLGEIEGQYPQTVSVEGTCGGRRHGYVVLEEMPEHQRRAARAKMRDGARATWGVFPANGATRRRVSREEAERLIDADAEGYTHVVGGGL